MKYSYVAGILFAGFLITQILAEEDGTKWAKAIRAEPEHPPPYITFGTQNFQGLKTLMDNYFETKKKEGDAIHAAGKAAIAGQPERQAKIEKDQYDLMFHTFKWAEGLLNTAFQPDGAGGAGGEGGDATGGATDTPPEAPAEAAETGAVTVQSVSEDD